MLFLHFETQEVADAVLRLFVHEILALTEIRGCSCGYWFTLCYYVCVYINIWLTGCVYMYIRALTEIRGCSCCYWLVLFYMYMYIYTINSLCIYVHTRSDLDWSLLLWLLACPVLYVCVCTYINDWLAAYICTYSLLLKSAAAPLATGLLCVICMCVYIHVYDCLAVYMYILALAQVKGSNLTHTNIHTHCSSCYWLALCVCARMNMCT